MSAAANPFGKPAALDAVSTQAAPVISQQPAAGQPASGIPAPKATGIPSLPVPATRGRGGAYQAPRGAARGGTQRGGRGGQQGGRTSMNGSAAEFQPGNKRPRGELEAAGNGAKRVRGGGAVGQ